MKKNSLIESFHNVFNDPGLRWVKEDHVSIDSNSPLDNESVLTPNVVRLSCGKFRMYYTGLGTARPIANSLGYILSAISKDGLNWNKEEGIRIDVMPPYACNRVLCPEVIPLEDGRWRMYFEGRTNGYPSVILSALSDDGLDWQYESGVRVSNPNWSLGSPRCLLFQEKKNNFKYYRLYFHHWSFPFKSGIDSKNHIISAISNDGINFETENGVRILQEDKERESYVVYGSEVIKYDESNFRMYYSGWGEHIRGGIFSAYSNNGLDWVKEPGAVIDLDRTLDSFMISEPCIMNVSESVSRMYYEAEDKDGKHRILSAVSI